MKKEVVGLLSRITGFTPEYIEAHAKNLVYVEKRIPKGNGKFRTLHVPWELLKVLQKAILERVLYSLPVSQIAHCAIRGRSIKTHTLPHTQSKSFFRIDFKDAFPSVNKSMLTKRLIPLFQNWLDSLHITDINVYDLVDLIAQLTLYRNRLPQGAPCSPYLLNLICFELDKKLLKISSDYNLVYTRYADDLWFSSQEPLILKEARSHIVETVKKYGFIINREKVKYKTGAATVPKMLGINLVKGKMKIPRKSVENYRTKIHLAITNTEIPVEEVLGIISFVTMVEGNKIPKRLRTPFKNFLKKRCPEKISSYVFEDVV